MTIKEELVKKQQEEKERLEQLPEWAVIDHYEKAEELLNDGTILPYAQEYLNHSVVGEKANRKGLYLAFMNLGSHIIVRGETSQGKSYITNNVLRLIPPERYFTFGGFSQEAPKYLLSDIGDEIDIIYLQEDEANKDKNLAIRFTSSEDGGGTFIVTEWSEEEKKWAPVPYKIGIKTFITTSIKVEIDPQALSRSHEFYVDSSMEQTKAICEEQARKARYPFFYEDHTFEQKVLWLVYEDIRKNDFKVTVPFYNPEKLINLNYSSWFMRRDNKRIIQLIENFARLNYRNRVTFSRIETINEEDKEVNYLIADIEDIVNAFELLTQLKNASTGTGLSPAEEELLDLMVNNGHQEYRSNDILGLLQEHGKSIESQDYVNKMLRKIHGAGYLFKEKDQQDKRYNVYYLSGKKAHHLTINHDKVEEVLTDWLDSLPDEIFEQITTHPNFEELKHKTFAEIPDLLKKKETEVIERPAPRKREDSTQQTFEISDTNVQKLKQVLKGSNLKYDLLKGEFRELEKETFDTLLINSQREGVIQKDQQGFYYLIGGAE